MKKLLLMSLLLISCGRNKVFIEDGSAKLNQLEQYLMGQILILEGQINSLVSTMNTINVDLSSQISALDAEITNLYAALEDNKLEVYKCDANNSTEKLLKFQGQFYAIMNRVTTQTIQVITGTTSQNVAVPLLCTQGGSDNLKLGPCGSGQHPVPDTGVTVHVPAYSTQNITVVASVKIALETLTDGTYQTTDGGPACVFKITNGGTDSENLSLVGGL
jgi:hypothetical protein